MIFLSQLSNKSNNMRVEHYALIIQLITSLYCIMLPVARTEVSTDGLAPVKNTEQSTFNPTLMITDPNQQLDCKCDNGTCVTDGNKTVCVCDPGFGKIGRTTCKACECGAGFSCTFDVGFFSTTKKCLCTEGFLERNGVCKECNCGKKGDCNIDTKGAKICSCNSGYVEINGHCEDCACGFENTTCQIIENIKFCACPSGYRDNRGVCEDIDECQLSGVCPSHTRCINTPGSYECACDEGYERKSNTSNTKFDGCQDIDECLNNKTCPFSDTLCVNLPGSYKCACEEGYQAINLQGDPRYTRCRKNNASWHHVNIVLIVLLVASLAALLGVMLVKRRRSFLMSRNINAYENL